jgi:hypothetical protein
MRVLALSLLLLAARAGALVKSDFFELNADLQAGASLQRNPPTEYAIGFVEFQPPSFVPTIVTRRFPYYAQENSWFAGAELRLLGSAGPDWAELKYNGIFHYDRSHGGLETFGPPLEPHRSAQLKRAFPAGGDESVWVGLDQAYLRLRPLQPLSFSLGRQPINLATNFYLVPNDLFSPFAPNDFLRAYKPGVDAARLTWSLAPLAQLELIGAAGWRAERSSADGLNTESEQWNGEREQGRSALLARLHADGGGLAVGAMAGWDLDRELIGADFAADLGGGWSLTFEGNGSRYFTPRGVFLDRSSPLLYDLAAGISCQLSPTLNARLELEQKPDLPPFPGPEGMFPLRHEIRNLGALGLDWEAHALVKAGLANFWDFERQEGLLALNLSVSLADEADLILGGNIPWRTQAPRPDYATSFELTPLSGNVQIRWVL